MVRNRHRNPLIESDPLLFSSRVHSKISREKNKRKPFTFPRIPIASPAISQAEDSVCKISYLLNRKVSPYSRCPTHHKVIPSQNLILSPNQRYQMVHEPARTQTHIDEKETNLGDFIHHIDSLLKEGKTISIFLMDMQEHLASFFEHRFNQYERVINNQIELLERYKNGDNVHIFDINFRAGGATLERLLTPIKTLSSYHHFEKGDQNAFIKEDRFFSHDQNNQPVITKYSKLTKTLRTLNVTDIVLTGCYDEHCIFDTAKGAMEEGFSVHIDRQLTITLRIAPVPSYPEHFITYQAESSTRKLRRLENISNDSKKNTAAFGSIVIFNINYPAITLP